MATELTPYASLHAPSRALRRRRGTIVACVLLAVAAAVGLSLLASKSYTASASVLLQDPEIERTLFRTPAEPGVDPLREAATDLRLASLRPVAARTAARVGGGLSTDDVVSKVRVAPDGQANVLSVTATEDGAVKAARLADAFAAELVADRARTTRRQVAVAAAGVRARLAALPAEQRDGSAGRELTRRLDQLETLAAVRTGGAEVVERAKVPSSASSPQPVRNGILGGVLGLLLGIGLVFLRERLDPRLRDVAELRAHFEGHPLLAAIPRRRGLRRLSAGAAPPADAQEAFHTLRANLSHFGDSRSVRSVLVVSPGPGDGKTTVAWHLARSTAAAGSPAAVVDADLRRPSVASVAGVEPAPGLAELAQGTATRDEVLQHWPGAPGGAGVTVVAAGEASDPVARVTESPAIGELVRGLEADHMLVVVDGPAAATVSDAVPLMRQVGGVIVVARPGATAREGVRQLAERLRFLQVPVLGVVANQVTRSDELYLEDARAYSRTRRTRPQAGSPPAAGDDPSAPAAPLTEAPSPPAR